MYLIFPFFLCLAVGLVVLANKRSTISFNRGVVILLFSSLTAVLLFEFIYSSIGIEVADFLDAKGFPNVVMFPLLPIFCMVCCLRIFEKVFGRRSRSEKSQA